MMHMKRISWSRVSVYALIYFVTGVAASAATSYWFTRFGPGAGQPMLIAGAAASMVVAAVVSFAFAVRSPTRPYVHAALAYLLSEILALAFVSLLSGVGGSTALLIFVSAMVMAAVLVGTAIGLRYHRARLDRRAE